MYDLFSVSTLPLGYRGTPGSSKSDPDEAARPGQPGLPGLPGQPGTPGQPSLPPSTSNHAGWTYTNTYIIPSH